MATSIEGKTSPKKRPRRPKRGVKTERGVHSREIRPSPLRPLFATFLEPFLAQKGGSKLENARGAEKGAKRYGKMPPQIAPLAAGGGPNRRFRLVFSAPFAPGPPKGQMGQKDAHLPP